MKSIKSKDIRREWHLLDAQDQILGRLTTKVVTLLIGKNKPYYTPHLDCGDYVVIINASKVRLSGKKEMQKQYFRHSGYPGGFKIRTAAEIRAQKPEELIRHAVGGMLPKTKLGKIMAKKLFVFAQSEHPYHDKIKNQK